MLTLQNFGQMLLAAALESRQFDEIADDLSQYLTCRRPSVIAARASTSRPPASEAGSEASAMQDGSGSSDTDRDRTRPESRISAMRRSQPLRSEAAVNDQVHGGHCLAEAGSPCIRDGEAAVQLPGRARPVTAKGAIAAAGPPPTRLRSARTFRNFPGDGKTGSSPR